MKNPNTGEEATGNEPESTLQSDVKAEIRRLSHEMSNGLEIVIQAAYLLRTANLDPSSGQWLDLLEQGVQRVTQINMELREYIRKQC